MFIPFVDDFTPDRALLNGGSGGGGSVTGSSPYGVINTGSGFAPFKAWASITSSAGVGDEPLGSFSFLASNGTHYTFTGIDDALKLVNGTNWTDVTRISGGAYATAAGDKWNFAAFGDRVIATNYTDVIQSYLAGTDTDFSALAGSPPKAKYIDVAGDFVILGYVNDGTAYPFRVQWSAQGDPTASWTPSATTQADYQDMNSNYGVVTGVSGFEDGFYAIQERAVTPFYYVGSPLIFRRGTTIPDVGCYIPSTLTKAGGSIFFRSRDGFKKISGGTVNHIGLGRVDITYANRINSAQYRRLTAFPDPQYPVVYFSAHTSTAASIPRELFAYNYIADRWTYWFDQQTGYYNFCVIFNSTYPTGALAGFLSSDNKLGSFTGANDLAVFETPMFMANKNGAKGQIDRVRIVGEGVTPNTVRIRSSASEFINSDVDNILTSAGNNSQFTGRVRGVGFKVGVVVTTWNPTYRMHGADIMEISEDGQR